MQTSALSLQRTAEPQQGAFRSLRPLPANSGQSAAFDMRGPTRPAGAGLSIQGVRRQLDTTTGRKLEHGLFRHLTSAGPEDLFSVRRRS